MSHTPESPPPPHPHKNVRPRSESEFNPQSQFTVKWHEESERERINIIIACLNIVSWNHEFNLEKSFQSLQGEGLSTLDCKPHSTIPPQRHHHQIIIFLCVCQIKCKQSHRDHLFLLNPSREEGKSSHMEISSPNRAQAKLIFQSWWWWRKQREIEESGYDNNIICILCLSKGYWSQFSTHRNLIPSHVLLCPLSAYFH